MRGRSRILPDELMSFAAIIAAAIVVAACTSESQAGIIAPQAVSFDAQELEASLSGDSARSDMSTEGRDAPLPLDDGDSSPTPLGLLKSSLPPNGNSSSGSSSPTGGAGTNVIAYVLSSAVTFEDDPAAVGKVAETRRLSLPDAPSSELLRPPHAR